MLNLARLLVLTVISSPKSKRSFTAYAFLSYTWRRDIQSINMTKQSVQSFQKLWPENYNQGQQNIVNFLDVTLNQSNGK